jgi:hypothetical protein
MKTKKLARKVKPKYPTRARAKRLAWTAFSTFIRQRDCLNSPSLKLGVGFCVTCDRSYPMAKLQAGHFVPGRHESVLFEETNCHAQCQGCNIFKSGNLIPYFEFMLEKYGIEEINRLRDLDKKIVHLKTQDFLAIRDKYVTKFGELLNTDKRVNI